MLMLSYVTKIQKVFNFSLVTQNNQAYCDYLSLKYVCLHWMFFVKAGIIDFMIFYIFKVESLRPFIKPCHLQMKM
jgi:hypothetical protein